MTFGFEIQKYSFIIHLITLIIHYLHIFIYIQYFHYACVCVFFFSFKSLMKRGDFDGARYDRN